MRSSHGCAAGSGITTVARIVARARSCSRRGDVRFSPVATISRNRTTAAKAGNSVCSGVQSSDRVGRLIKRRRIGHRGTTGAGVTCSYYHLDTGSFLSFNGGLQLVADNTTLRDRATPGVDCNIGCFGRVAFVRRAIQRIGREEKFHALHICGRCAVALVHVTASNPLCAGRHPDLVGAAIVTDRCARSMAAMKEIVTRLWRIRAANAATGMNAVMPAKIVIRVDSVPAAVMRFERVVRPANTGIRAGNDNSLPSEPKRPDIRRVRVSNARLDRRRRRGAAGLQRRLLDRASLRKVILNMGIACNARHVGASGQRVGDLSSALHHDRINDIEGLMLDVVFAQPLQDWPLCGLRLVQQGLINETALFGFSWQISGRAQIGLVCEHDKKFSLLSVGGVFHYPWRDLLRRRRMKRALRRQLNALADSVGRSDSSNERYSSCHEEQRTKNTPP